MFLAAYQETQRTAASLQAAGKALLHCRDAERCAKSQLKESWCCNLLLSEQSFAAGEMRRVSAAQRDQLHLLHLSCISPASLLHLSCISPASFLQREMQEMQQISQTRCISPAALCCRHFIYKKAKANARQSPAKDFAPLPNRIFFGNMFQKYGEFILQKAFWNIYKWPRSLQIPIASIRRHRVLPSKCIIKGTGCSELFSHEVQTKVPLLLFYAFCWCAAVIQRK